MAGFYYECQLVFDAGPMAIVRAARGIAFVELVGTARSQGTGLVGGRAMAARGTRLPCNNWGRSLK